MNPTNTVPEHNTDLRSQLEKVLATAATDTFQPNLDQLDAMLRSLKIKP